jgi:hypothetical protein
MRATVEEERPVSFVVSQPTRQPRAALSNLVPQVL